MIALKALAFVFCMVFALISLLITLLVSPIVQAYTTGEYDFENDYLHFKKR